MRPPVQLLRVRCFAVLTAVLALSGCRHAEEAPRASRGASEARAAVLGYLKAQAGKTILSGQMDLTWSPSTDMAARVLATTGKSPALMGYDLMDFTDRGTRIADADGQITEALAWARRGGLVTFCWHWRDPSGATNSFYKNGTHIPLKNGLFDADSVLGRAMTADLDFVAGQLALLRDAGVPVLWRPLHEGGGNGAADGSGAWFWWGQDGGAAYTALYRFMHDRFHRIHGLDNLIWVWNGQGPSYYPGNDVVDVGGQDVYDQNHGSQKAWFTALQIWAAGKPAALTEVGAIPDPASMLADGAGFSWFLVWNDNPTVSLAQAANNFWSGSGSAVEDAVNYPWNTPSFERRVYSHLAVITLDELPAF